MGTAIKMLPFCNNVATALFIFVYNFQYNIAELNNIKTPIPEETTEVIVFTTENFDTTQWSTMKLSKKFKIRKRTSRKNLGERCTTFRDCPPTALCVNGFCSCPYDYYTYVPNPDTELSVCRKKIKHGFLCTLTEDCIGYDSNSACLEGVCQCINGTHYISSRNLLSYNKRCYKILEKQGDVCDIDEQCSRLADNHHKCRCVGRCDCQSINRYTGCSICHENIKRTFFGGAAFIVLLLSSRMLTKMRNRANSRQLPQSGSRERCYRLNTSRTVPSVSYTRTNLRANRHVASSLPDVFLIETHRNLFGLHTSNTTDFYPQTSPSNTSAGHAEDAPPSYEDIVGDDRLIWNEPPPSYQEITAKSP